MLRWMQAHLRTNWPYVDNLPKLPYVCKVGSQQILAQYQRPCVCIADRVVPKANHRLGVTYGYRPNPWPSNLAVEVAGIGGTAARNTPGVRCQKPFALRIVAQLSAEMHSSNIEMLNYTAARCQNGAIHPKQVAQP